MQDFMLLFRVANSDHSQPSAEEIKAIQKRWDDWKGGIAAQGKMANNGSRLPLEGKVLKAGGVVTDGPFVEIREMLGGYIVVKADSLDDAVTLAHGCPAMDMGGSVEIRPLPR
jgi:hypothetical protein